MIPKNNTNQDIEIIIQPTKTYRLNIERNNVSGYVDNLEAVKQVIYKILNTERFKSEIYSWNYGIELQDLIGEPKEYVYPELKRRITEALTQDDRITGVDAFMFVSRKNEAHVTFTVHTIYGDVPAQKLVNI